ncbi:hypothetical protein DUI87_10432 [Hirundo rustica rustica]|uniref:Uncharacterized protein n=1 Tax=Hirundo rustica rustica TaxID=333673 RepID=A0A3M0KIM2_HIRRU|nr:hypothetical protein DUI87_10432 [Hirundo rustica rustica]
MKFNKSECWILNLGWGNPVCLYSLGNEGMESSAAEKDLGVLVQGELSMSHCALTARRANPVLGYIVHSMANPVLGCIGHSMANPVLGCIVHSMANPVLGYIGHSMASPVLGYIGHSMANPVLGCIVHSMANPVLGCIGHSMASRARVGIVLLCSELGRPHLQCWGQFWVTHYIKDIKLFESIQRKATKMVEGLGGSRVRCG